MAVLPPIRSPFGATLVSPFGAMLRSISPTLPDLFVTVNSPTASYKLNGSTWSPADCPYIGRAGRICTDGVKIYMPYIFGFSVNLATFDGKTWSTQLVATSGSISIGPSACAHDGTRICVVYGESGSNSVKAAISNGTGGFDNYTLTSSALYGNQDYFDVATDGVHFYASYVTISSGFYVLNVATFSGGSWSNAVLPSLSATVSRITANSSGIYVVSDDYVAPGVGEPVFFVYQSTNGVSWTATKISDKRPDGYALAITANGAIVISAFVDISTGDLVVATLSSGSWSTSVLATGDGSFASSSAQPAFATDNDHVYLIFETNTTDGAMLATFSGGSWSIQGTDVPGLTNRLVSMATKVSHVEVIGAG